MADCPVGEAFRYVRLEGSEALPPVDPRIIDVAILDMNHG